MSFFVAMQAIITTRINLFSNRVINPYNEFMMITRSSNSVEKLIVSMAGRSSGDEKFAPDWLRPKYSYIANRIKQNNTMGVETFIFDPNPVNCEEIEGYTLPINGQVKILRRDNCIFLSAFLRRQNQMSHSKKHFNRQNNSMQELKNRSYLFDIQANYLSWVNELLPYGMSNGV